MTPVILYTSDGKPVGPRAVVQIYRPTYSDDPTGTYPAGYTKPKVADVIPFGAAGATELGDPVEISELSISFNSTTTKTQGIFGESNNDPTIGRGDPTLNIGSFIRAAGAPTLLPGDFIEISIGMKATSTPDALVRVPASRWVFTANNIATAGANKNSISAELDRDNSDPTLAEF